MRWAATLLLGFLAAVAFATILAVVAGLALAGAAAVSHDIYARVISKGTATEKEEVRVSKITVVVLGLIAIVLGIAFEKMNIAFMVGLAFGVAAAANFPVLILSMYWKGLTTRGALWGGYGGVISSVLFVFFSKSVWVDVIGFKQALFLYTQPAIFCMPIAFGLAYIMSVTDKSAQAQAEKEAFEDQYVRAQTGLGSAAPTGKH
jgi:cation/acetate symporter